MRWRGLPVLALALAAIGAPGALADGTLTWSHGARGPIGRIDAQGAAVGGELYVFGGFDDSALDQTVESDAYDLASNSWRPLPDLPEQVTHAGVAVDGSDVYLAGGFVGPAYWKDAYATADVWRFDTLTETWSAMPPLPQARGSGALVVLDGALHFIGGANLRRVEHGTHWVLPLDGSSTWQVAAPMPHPRTHFGAAVVDGRIYAVGGQTGHDRSERVMGYVDAYDPATDSWSEVAPLPFARSHIASSTFAFDGLVYVLGGETAHSHAALADAVAYDPDLNAWSTLAPLPHPRTAGVADAVDGTLVLSTGSLLPSTFLGSG